MRPRLPAILSAPGELGHRFALDCSRRNFGLRTLLAVSSVASGRIEFVSRPLSGHYSTDYPFTSSCSPPRVATTQLLSVTGGKLRQRGTLTLLCTLTLKRTSADLRVCCVAAMVQAGLGERDQAFSWLARVVEERDTGFLSSNIFTPSIACIRTLALIVC